jgi:hypothetical protein
VNAVLDAPAVFEQGQHDMGVPYDVDAFAQIEAGYGESIKIDTNAVVNAMETGNLTDLRSAIGSLLLNVGQRIGDQQMIAEAARFTPPSAAVMTNLELEQRGMHDLATDEDE